MGNRVFCSGSMCPKATLQPAGDNELFDDTNACDPAGTIFNETLEDLNEVDRLLLLFSSSTNLAAARWLFVLGANADACDTNGVTCLHSACRSGSLQVVREFISRGLPLDAVDIAGWTPLHVSLFMGRRSVALELLQFGADLSIRNGRGLLPSDLCSDVWLREAISACAAHRHSHGPERPWEFDRVGVCEDIQISSRLRFEPFFVPRAAALRDLKNTISLQQLGVEIFNHRPGQGLAFLVSTGSVRDFPVELSSFLSEHQVSLAQVGEFLGEDFSLSQTLRLEYINAVRLMSTGVVSALAKVFKQFRIPSDMQKIDRLIDGIAQIWWRQHEQLREKDYPSREDDKVNEDGEVEGLRLMRHFSSYDELHQLMFSAVMLHWNLYAPLPPSQRIMPDQWLSMNAVASSSPSTGGTSGLDDPEKVSLRQVFSLVYNMISRNFYPQLQIWSNQPESTGMPCTPSSPGTSMLPSAEDECDGWAFLVGGGFPSFAGSSGTITYRHIRSILSETTTTAVTLASPNVSRQQDAVAMGHRHHDPSRSGMGGAGPGIGAFSTGHGELRLSPAPGEVIVQSGRQDWVWLAVRSGLLLLAPKPNHWAPYAFVNLCDAIVQNMDRASLIITLVASSTNSKPADSTQGRAMPGLRCNGGVSSDGTLPPEAEGPQLQLIFLLPDGRWQVLEIPRLKVQVPDTRQLDQWRACLAMHCRMADAGGVIPEHAKMADEEVDSAEV